MGLFRRNAVDRGADRKTPRIDASRRPENRDDLSRARCSSAKRRIPLLKRIVLVDGEELVNRANEVEKKPEIEERRKTAIHFYRFDYPKYERFTFFSLRAIVVDWRSLKVFRRHSTPRLDIYVHASNVLCLLAQNADVLERACRTHKRIRSKSRSSGREIDRTFRLFTDTTLKRKRAHRGYRPETFEPGQPFIGRFVGRRVIAYRHPVLQIPKTMSSSFDVCSGTPLGLAFRFDFDPKDTIRRQTSTCVPRLNTSGV